MKETTNSNTTTAVDARLVSLNQWLLEIGFTDYLLEPASQDASFRRYFRMTRKAGKSLILMDAPPANESLSPFMEIAADWSTSKISVPQIFNYSRDLGFLILEDFGNITFLKKLSQDNIESQYRVAIDELIKIQKHKAEFALPDYSQELLLSEMGLFVDWFVVKHCRYQISKKERQALENSFYELMQSAYQQKQVTVHRDYHSRNLMLSTDERLGVIDFQDAVRGPLSYDLVSLLKDCYFKLCDSKRDVLLGYYLQQATRAKLVDESDLISFKERFELMGVQRHLKAIGIFCRLFHRDGKENYLEDIPLTASYITELGNSNSVLTPINEILVKCLSLIESNQ